jgi:hypothetical protein
MLDVFVEPVIVINYILYMFILGPQLYLSQYGTN